MKVLLINNFHYRKGGSETVYFNTAELLRRNGHEVRFFSFLDEKSEHDGSETLVDRPAGKISGLFSYVNNRSAAARLDALLDEYHPDVAHIHLFWGGLSSSILPVLKKHGVRVVHTAHDYRLACPAYLFLNGKVEICEKCRGGKFCNCALGRCSKGSLLNSLVMTAEMYYRQAFRSPAKYLDGIIYVSEFSKRKHIEMQPSLADVRSIVLHNFTSLTPSRDCGRGDYFLYMGRLSAEKGIGTMIEAFAGMPDLRLKIVGDGPLRASMEAISAEKNASNIEFTGYKSGQELTELVRNASFLVIPSQCYENNPMSVIEAFACGKPVIGADIGGIPELVSASGAGFLFSPSDAEGLKECLEKAAGLSEDEYDELSERAVEFVAADSDVNAYAARLLEFYRG